MNVGQQLSNAPITSASRGINTALTLQMGYIIGIVLVVIVLLVIILYIVRLVLKSSKERTILVKKPFKLDGSPVTISGSKIVATLNGQEFTYSFWIYLSDEYTTTQNSKRIMMRGGVDGDLTSANPIVFLEPASNKMFLVLQTNKSIRSEGGRMANSLNAIKDLIDTNASNQPLHIAIDYIPMQRWVHIALSFQDGILTVYMDGTIYAVKSVEQVKDDSEKLPIVRATTGDVVLGSETDRTAGFLTQLEFYNYFMSQQNIMDLYQRGPSGGGVLRNLFGMDEYGVRNPFYRKTVDSTMN